MVSQRNWDFYAVQKAQVVLDSYETKIALMKLGRHKHFSSGNRNRCPRCRIPLRTSFYEGVPTQTCEKCGGKLIKTIHVERIIARKEVAFSQTLLDKAKKFKHLYMQNPFRSIRTNLAKTSSPACPYCGTKMVLRPYTYQYIVPVDKCLACQNVWFDMDELEILQILIENR